MPAPDQNGFYTLWPTHMLQRIVPGHEQPNLRLKHCIESLAASHEHGSQHYNTDYAQQAFFEIHDPAVEWLQACVNKTIVDYLANQKINYSIDWSLQAWANINKQGDYHNLHNHPHSYLSGTYYVAVPAQKIANEQRTDLNPGAISFFDPRAQANMNAIAGDAQVEAEFRVDPVAGMILLWPSFLHHFVHPNASAEARISISFNVMPKWTDAFIPDGT